MNEELLQQLIRKYYGHIIDMEGSGAEILELLFVRDKIQQILDQSLPEDKLSLSLYGHLYELDQSLWQERETFLVVLGEQMLKHAREQRLSPRSHWWWYLDELRMAPILPSEQRYHSTRTLSPVFA
ncbi:MAG TPA: hypothetical protein G4N96_09510 [Chloroflexi bacterium]|nr:hypothetical protein [Chloroflexota bacterium]